MLGLIIFLKVLLTILIILLGLLFMLLVIPFQYDFYAGIKEKIEGEATIGWLWGLLKLKFLRIDEKHDLKIYVGKMCININQSTKSIKKKKNIEKENKQQEKNKKSKRSILEFFQKQFIYNTKEFLKKVIKIIKPKLFRVSGVYGFEDPALTGVICGIVSLIKTWIPHSKIYLEPIFDDEVMDIQIQVSGGCKLFSILFELLRYVLKKVNRKIIFKKMKKVETFQ